MDTTEQFNCDLTSRAQWTRIFFVFWVRSVRTSHDITILGANFACD